MEGISLRAEITDGALYTVKSEMYSVSVRNRPPVAAVESKEATVYFDIPDEETPQSLRIDLSEFFTDPDDDPLVYKSSAMPAETGSLRIEGQVLVYTPASGSASTEQPIEIFATDRLPEETDPADEGEAAEPAAYSASVSLTIHQQSITELLSALRFKVDLQASKNVSISGDGTLQGVLHEEAILVLYPDNAEWLNDYQQATQESLPLISTNLHIFPTEFTVNNQQEAYNQEMTTPDADGAMQVVVALPASDRATEYGLVFQSSYRSLMLPDLLPAIHVSIDNQTPYLLDTDTAYEEFKAEIDGFPWEFEPLPVNVVMQEETVNFNRYFNDLENGGQLQFTVQIAGDAEYSLEHATLEPASDAEEPSSGGVSTYRLSPEDGNGLFALTIRKPGELSVSISASDDQFTSSDSLHWTFHVTSSFWRIAMYAALRGRPPLRYFCA